MKKVVKAINNLGENLALITIVCLYSTEHWIGASVLLVILIGCSDISKPPKSGKKK